MAFRLEEWLDLLWLQITEIVAVWGYWGIGVGMAIESANIPLPSEIILPFGGFMVSQGRAHFLGVVLAGSIGGTVGSVISYFIGSWGGRPLIIKYGRYFGLSEKKLALADEWFARYGEMTVFITRLLPVIRTFISFPAGISRMNLYRFIIYTFWGSFLWSIALTYVGLLLGENWYLVKTWFHRLDYLVVGTSLLVLLWWVIRSSRLRHRP